VRMSQLGEKGYIRRLFSRYRSRPNFTARADDAAIIRLNSTGQSVALKIDRGPSSVAYKFGLSGRIVDGRLAATACCSDLLAAWSRPYALMISVTVPPETTDTDLDAALDGFMEVCENYNVQFVGGDTKAGPWNLVACGLGEIDTVGARRGAGRPGDCVVVCGEIGSFTAATLRAMGITKCVELDDAIDVLCHPAARWYEAGLLRETVTPSSVTDASDGAYEAMLNVVGEGFGVTINEDLLPFSQMARRVSEECSIPLSNFLYGGGDWNLVLAVPKKAVEAVKDLGSAGRARIAVVGEVTSEPGFWMSSGIQSYRKLTGMISDHFLGRIEDPTEYFGRLRNYSGWDDLS
jgi:thiamine-monophosphate kinase